MNLPNKNIIVSYNPAARGFIYYHKINQREFSDYQV